MRRGANVQIAYYDQQREQLDPERTVFDTVGDGNDTVTVNGQPRTSTATCATSCFGAERARSPVKALSGGERNRLLLARLFTRPANVLVLDEPTNDLDLETLELLEAQLVEWPGTLLLVSHDRVFLDNVVTSTLVFEGDGADQRVRRRLCRLAAPAAARIGSSRRAAPREKSRARRRWPRGCAGRRSTEKLSFKEQRELARAAAAHRGARVRAGPAAGVDGSRGLLSGRARRNREDHGARAAGGAGAAHAFMPAGTNSTRGATPESLRIRRLDERRYVARLDSGHARLTGIGIERRGLPALRTRVALVCRVPSRAPRRLSRTLASARPRRR